MNTQTVLDYLSDLVYTFSTIYEWFSNDLGSLTGIAALNGLSVLEGMLGGGVVFVLGYTLVKWVLGVIS